MVPEVFRGVMICLLGGYGSLSVNVEENMALGHRLSPDKAVSLRVSALLDEERAYKTYGLDFLECLAVSRF
jgi:hypothetical protein